jgi:hypothetical protein
MRGASARPGINKTWPPKGRARRSMLALATVTAAVGGILILSATGGTSVAGADPSSITLCHATAATTHPYVVITVAPNSINQLIFEKNGHNTHTGPVFDPNGGKDQPVWGDIIPPFDWNTPTQHYDGLNWTDAGMAIWNNGCQIPGTPPTTEPPTTEPPTTEPPTTEPPTTEPPTTEPPTTEPPTTEPPTTEPPTTEPPTSGGSSGSSAASSSASSSFGISGAETSATTSSSAPIPGGVSAGLHTPVANAGLKAWGTVLLLLGGATGLLAGLWPTRRRAH